MDMMGVRLLLGRYRILNSFSLPLIFGSAVLCFMSRLVMSRHFLTALASLPRLYDRMIPVGHS